MAKFGLLQPEFGVLQVDNEFFVNLDKIEQNLFIDSDIEECEEIVEDMYSEDNNTVISRPDYTDKPMEKLSKQKLFRMRKLRHHVNQLTEKLTHHHDLTDKTRDELNQCRNKIFELQLERNHLWDKQPTQEKDGNQAAFYRVKAQYERLGQEILNEKDKEKLIIEKLEKEEYDLAKVEIERGKFLLEEHELVKNENILAKNKTILALMRLKTEKKNVLQAKKNMKYKHRIQQELIKKKQHLQQLLAKTAHKNQEHNKFLIETIEKCRQRQEEEEIRVKEDMQRKMDMVLKLKSDITANRENLKAIQARNKAVKKQEQQKCELFKQQVREEHGDPDQMLLIQKRIDLMEKKKLQFAATVKQNEISVVQKILTEEERMERRKKQYPLFWEDAKKEKSKRVAPQHKKLLKTFQEYLLLNTEMDISCTITESLDFKNPFELDKPDTEMREGNNSDTGDMRDILVADPIEIKEEESSSTESVSDAESDDHVEPVDLAEYEFEGLWEHHIPYTVSKETEPSPLKLPGASKMDKAILAEKLKKQRANIVVRQVVAGREFTGRPFCSKPDVIHFKDFDVGKTYKKKVILTNASYTVNTCKYVDVTERLKDFITIQFNQPGQMSAGLTCEIIVTFQPMINQDLEGEVKFLSQTGPFSVPLKCTTKKCFMSVDVDAIQFGTAVVGETIPRTFTLTNKGALGTTFEFFKVTGITAKTVIVEQSSLEPMTTKKCTLSPIPESAEVGKVKKETQTLETTETETTDDTLKQAQSGQVPLTDGKGQQGAPEGDSLVTQPGEENVSRDVLNNEMDDYSDLDGMKVGTIATGEIGPFATIKLRIIWSPKVPGKVNTKFLISFADPQSDSITVHAVGNAIDVPVWVDRQTVDLRICMFDRLYQDSIVIHNRATFALRLIFEVCKELRNHLELLPKTGFIQAQQSFTAQLKFLPRPSLFEEAGMYFDKETGVLEAAMIIRVADQTAPIHFTMTAVLTNSDIEFDVQEIDFGYCTIYESNKTAIKLTNKSILPQKFGFIGHPDYVEVQPNHGFGTLLPLETLEMEVIFSPPKASEYKFDLNCKSIINRDFKIHCKGTCVHPPLEFSHQVIHFAATSLYDVTTTSLYVINSHTGMSEYAHPLPRIGSGAIAPAGPTSFEFVIPKGAPVMISPSVGTIDPGQRKRIQVRFAPTLNEEDILKEAVGMATKLIEQQAEKDFTEAMERKKEFEEAQKTAAGAGGKKQGGAKSPVKAAPVPKGKQTPGNVPLVVTGPQTVQLPKAEEIKKDSPVYAAAVSSLLRHFKGKFISYTVPCYVVSGECTRPGKLSYSVHNTLYLQVHCPAVQPPLVVISDYGKTTTDFGDVSLGQSIVKSITVQNISNKILELSSSNLDTVGPFEVINAFRVLEPGEIHTITIAFVPNAGRVFQEQFWVSSLTAQLHITLKGRGVSPLVTLPPTIVDGGIMDMGTVLAGEYIEKTFKMQNASSLSIEYVIFLESHCLLHHFHAPELPEFQVSKANTFVGVQNNKGTYVFDLVPAEGRIAPGSCVDVTVTFAPDHPSDFFSDGVKIVLFGTDECHKFQLKGTAKETLMFIEGGEPLHTDGESLALRPVLQLAENDLRQHMKTVLVTLKCMSKDDSLIPVLHEIYIGCVRSMTVGQKKSGEFTFDNAQLINHKGFTVDPLKGTVEAGVLKPVKFSWITPAGYDPNLMMEATIVVTLKADVPEQYQILLRAMTVSE